MASVGVESFLVYIVEARALDGHTPVTVKRLKLNVEDRHHKRVLELCRNTEPFRAEDLNAYCIGDHVGGGSFSTVRVATNGRLYPGQALVVKRLRTLRNTAVSDWWEPALRELTVSRLIKQRSAQERAHLLCLVDVFLDTLHRPVFVYPKYDCDFQKICEAPQFRDWCKNRRTRLLWMRQVMHALVCLHQVNVIHRDVKPQNILVRRAQDPEDFELVLGDFGSCRMPRELLVHGYRTALSRYVVTRYFRPPEVAFGCETYNDKVDIWSAGVLFVLMLTGGQYPAIADDSIRYQQAVMDLLGSPCQEDYEYYCLATEVRHPCRYVQSFINLNKRQRQLRPPTGMSWLRYRLDVPCKDATQATEEELALVERMLTWNPLVRLSAHAVLQELDAMLNDGPASSADPLPLPLSSPTLQSTAPCSDSNSSADPLAAPVHPPPMPVVECL